MAFRRGGRVLRCERTCRRKEDICSAEGGTAPAGAGYVSSSAEGGAVSVRTGHVPATLNTWPGGRTSLSIEEGSTTTSRAVYTENLHLGTSVWVGEVGCVCVVWCCCCKL